MTQHTPQKRISEHAVEKNVEVPVPQIEVIGVVQVFVHEHIAARARPSVPDRSFLVNVYLTWAGSGQVQRMSKSKNIFAHMVDFLDPQIQKQFVEVVRDAPQEQAENRGEQIGVLLKEVKNQYKETVAENEATGRSDGKSMLGPRLPVVVGC